MIIENNNAMRNNLVKMFNVNKNYIHNEVTRLGSFQHKDVSYRRNSILNFGSKQMINIGDNSFLRIGIGGPPVVGA